MKIFIKTVTLAFGLFANSVAFSQNVKATFSPAEIVMISTDGTLEKEIIVTLDGIPNGAQGIGELTFRIYPKSSTAVGGDQVAICLAKSSIEFDANIDNDLMKTTTTANSPSSGFYKKVYTIKKVSIATNNVPSGSLTVGDNLQASIRFVSPTTSLATLNPPLIFDGATLLLANKRAVYMVVPLKVTIKDSNNRF